VLDRFSNRSMKRFAYLLVGMPFIGILLTSCGKYQSSIEANIACKEWAKKGGEFILQGYYEEYSLENLERNGKGMTKSMGDTSKRTIRYCEEDAKTKKYLGYTHTNIKANEIVEVKCYKPKEQEFVIPCLTFWEGSGKIEKRFAY